MKSQWLHSRVGKKLQSNLWRADFRFVHDMNARPEHTLCAYVFKESSTWTNIQKISFILHGKIFSLILPSIIISALS